MIWVAVLYGIMFLICWPFFARVATKTATRFVTPVFDIVFGMVAALVWPLTLIASLFMTRSRTRPRW